MKKVKQLHKLPSENIDPKDSFDYYRKEAKLRKVVNTKRKSNHRKITACFWNKVSENLIEKEAGVLVNGLGYFCVSMVPEKQLPYKKGVKGRHINPHTKSKIYFPVLITTKHDKVFNVFNMDRAFSKKVRKGIQRKLKSGFKYSNYFKEVNGTFMNRYRKYKNR
ncbi:hypothetical protein Phi4:1_gp044 [Cellulophaga phage phi4:1]|uniref:Uncharacterized protein n=5 Tax=Lightbulbvirus TaxID=1918522 RepID=A0A0S2MWH2_9CAUD|nr:hypothetical protein Phi4:1_gp044 [Cellulophaga phage phi4:1]YP_008241540.1 hypothetical protein Phi17:2_gp045 [Cellulophaga phage phi17:2]ALO80053.1 hypothetical protein Phi4113_044 [Cellulophaga phage phi4:1_13]ALO80250.1 hypothetical protein Phi4118_044 [Cellulophaga phage phi4:1_18]ALO80448.1 hypothetical protein Phi17218_045 [Cellulophaga phage phi17:2_18]AGO47578.1 hypothetical protein Phi17:2_gp045 [Cellulophaga phage phi17:2]AGO49457.1 hypothetical protein Phi4:1_gp044 [Cellulophag